MEEHRRAPLGLGGDQRRQHVRPVERDGVDLAARLRHLASREIDKIGPFREQRANLLAARVIVAGRPFRGYAGRASPGREDLRLLRKRADRSQQRLAGGMRHGRARIGEALDEHALDVAGDDRLGDARCVGAAADTGRRRRPATGRGAHRRGAPARSARPTATAESSRAADSSRVDNSSSRSASRARVSA